MEVILKITNNMFSVLVNVYIVIVISQNLPVRTIMNAAPVRKDFPTEIISLSDVFCVNETEVSFNC